MPGAFAKVSSYGVYGIEPYQVAVEVKESRERVRAAIGNSGLWNPVVICELQPVQKDNT